MMTTIVKLGPRGQTPSSAGRLSALICKPGRAGLVGYRQRWVRINLWSTPKKKKKLCVFFSEHRPGGNVDHQRDIYLFIIISVQKKPSGRRLEGLGTGLEMAVRP